MINYEEALNKAKEHLEEIDHCTEYEKGYVFNCKKYEYEIGGEHMPCVILKDSGRAVALTWFYQTGAGKEIREFDVK